MTTERHTIQKQIVYDKLCRMANHPTADDIFESLHPEYPGISKATVYRILNKLAESGTILKVCMNNGADHFDHQTFPHYHVKCLSCGRVCDVSLPYFDKLEARIKEACGYRITGYSLQFDGLCPDCQNTDQI